MIVTCEACETQFQLDDSKVPDGGIRVRCSRCKHAFHIESPSAPDTDRADELARDALQPERPPVAAPRGREKPADDAEADWQFNEEVAPPSAAPSAPRAAAQVAVDDLLGGVASLPSAVRPPPEPEPEPAGPDDFAAAAGAGDDLEIPDLADPTPEIAADPPEAAAAPAPFAGDAVDDLTDDPDALAGEAPAESSDGDALFEDVDDFDDFDADGDPEDFAVPESAPEPAPLPVDAEAVAVARIRAELPTEIETGSGARQKKRPHRDSDFDVEGEAGSAWMARVRGGLGWAVVVGLVAYTTAAGLWPTRPAGADRAPAQAVGGMLVEGVEGRWVENVAGPLYVVGGWLRADAAQAPEPGVQLRVRLVDSRGVAPVSVSSAVGPPMRLEQLREASLPDLREAHERRALRMAWKRLRSGERRPFQAIFAEVPAAATAFEFQAVPVASPPLERSEPPVPAFPVTEPTGEITEAPTG